MYSAHSMSNCLHIFGYLSDEGGELGGSEAAGGVDRFLRQFSHAMRR